MRIFVCQLNPIIGDLAANTKKILDSLEKARLAKAELVLFSELVLSGYPPEDLLLQKDFIAEHSYYLVILGLLTASLELIQS